MIDTDNVIIAGHTRLKAAQRLGLETVPVIVADDLTPEQVKAFRVADNKTAELAEWDFEKLKTELAELIDFDMQQFGFDEIEDFDEIENALEINKESLQQKFIVPPFSVLDTRQGYWQDRKSVWKQIIKSNNGRDDELLGGGLKNLAKMQGAALTGTSIFDPVLCEVLINWFCPPQGKILDPFAGGSVRGLISVLLGRDYTGIDLRQEQIDANYNNLAELNAAHDLNGDELKKPHWICDDSLNMDDHINEKYDFLLTCPPYADLEVYSDDPRDISNMQYEQFIETYGEILHKAFCI